MILGTFDTTHGEEAMAAFGDGSTVRCGYVENGKFKNLTSIEVLESDNLPL
jgi:hypothetical protein